MNVNCLNWIAHHRIDEADGKLKRYYRGDTDWTPTNNGGETVVHLRIGGKDYFGIAVCNKKDNFCYKDGRRIALYRALIQVPYYLLFDIYPDFYELETYVKYITEPKPKYKIVPCSISTHKGQWSYDIGIYEGLEQE